VVNREDVQLLMIANLEQTQPRVAILSKVSQLRDERNESRNMGASILDQYINLHYRRIAESNRYVLALRQPSSIEDLAGPL
jgi:hypothetical protein